MDTPLEQLQKQAAGLFEKEQYKELIELLPDDVLEQYKDAVLYTWRARAHGRLEQTDICFEYAEKAIQNDNSYFMGFLARGNSWSEKGDYDKAIADYNKAIELKNDDSVAYYNRGNSWYAKGDYDKAIADYSKAIELKKDDNDAYNNRGLSWYANGDYDKAIADYNKAIDLKNDDSGAYNNRGLSWYANGEYDKAIADYSKAIELKNDDSGVYNNRGIAWHNKGEYDKAIADYSKAIELKHDYADAYNNRGVAWKNKGDVGKAIADYSKTIALKKDYALAYRNRGIVHEIQNKLQKAKKDYKNAVKYNPKDAYAQSLLDKLLAKLGEPIPETKEEIDDSFYTDDSFQKIKELVKELNGNQQTEILQLYQRNIDPKIKDIRELAINTEQVWKEALKDEYTDTDPKLVAHYSSLKTADILIMKNKGKGKETGEDVVSKMWYSNAVFMNDPEEGRVLIEYLDKLEKDKKQPPEIKAAFENALKEEKTNFYLGSFLPVIKNHEDELLMWRTYGKDENLNEAAGCCILLGIDFFDEHDGEHMALGRERETPQKPHPLYKVLYYDQRDGGFVGTDKGKIEKLIAELKGDLKKLLGKKVKKETYELDEYEKKLNNTIDKVLYHSLSELRYFFKSSDYSYENELRVIQFATHANVVKIDDAGSVPRKMYIESTKDIKPYLKKIVLGPKVQHPDRWAYLAEKMRRDGYEMEVSYSTCHFR